MTSPLSWVNFWFVCGVCSARSRPHWLCFLFLFLYFGRKFSSESQGKAESHLTHKLTNSSVSLMVTCTGDVRDFVEEIMCFWLSLRNKTLFVWAKKKAKKSGMSYSGSQRYINSCVWCMGVVCTLYRRRTSEWRACLRNSIVLSLHNDNNIIYIYNLIAVLEHFSVWHTDIHTENCVVVFILCVSNFCLSHI